VINSFRKKEASREFSCILCPLPWKVAREILQWGKENIPDKDLIGDGRESSIHITVKYGLHDHDPFELRPLLQNYGPIEIILGKLSIFENGKEDVVKINVTSPKLIELNLIITNRFENTTTHDKFIPHCTIGYVKPGLGKKYDGNDAFEGMKVILDKAEFSGNDYRETTFSMDCRGGR
jgi:2'-5' RNA ligase